MKRFKMLKGIGSLIICTFVVTMMPFKSMAQEFEHKDLWSFETINKKQWQLSDGHKISSSEKHYKHQTKSLHWQWKKPGDIVLMQPINFKPFDPRGADKSIASFAVWIYNETPVDDVVKFYFGTDKKDNCHFSFNLNFKGWRAAWVSFERDMEGEPQVGMNQLRIENPQSVKSGNLYIDHMFLCINIDSRHHTPDKQVPFVNAATKSHWLIQEKTSHEQPDIPMPEEVSKEQLKAFEQIAERFTDDILKKQKVSTTTVDKLEAQVAKYNIVRKRNAISGKPVWFARNAELYIPLADHSIAKLYRNNKQDLRSYFDLMFKIGVAYVNSDVVEHQYRLREMYMNMYEHMVDQGVAYGSGLGTIHHYGYNWRNYYRALFIMRDVLAEEGKLEEVTAGLQWYAALGEVFTKPEVKGMDMDAFNTQVMGRLASILIMEDTPQKVQYLQCFSRWIDNGLLPAPGLNDAFKIDGSAYHHANHYPAYATGGMNGAVRMVYFMSGTSFKVSTEAHENLKKALMTMRFYCNLTHWPLAMSGRHPEGKGKLHTEHFAILAKAGQPDGSSIIDQELATAYMRLVAGKKKDKYKSLFEGYDLTAEPTPQGHIVMPYASSSIHRRGEWAASVRGHSRYLWAAEHYLGANLYGRYLAHGQLQIMGKGQPVNIKASGFVQQGWDWNRMPGTTTINVPLDDLRAVILNVDQYSGYEEMLFSDEAFAGGVHADGKNGVYAFILHEHDKYQGSLRARKSWFFFDNHIVCLGSGIENTNNERMTETTLFQNHLAKNDLDVLVDGKSIQTELHELTGDNTWLRDNKGNAYYLPEGKVLMTQGIQHSRDESSEKPTQGVFATAVLQHGNAPKNQSYHYCVLPCVDDAKLKKPDYNVLQQDNDAHIVNNITSNEMAYVFFNKADNNTIGLVKSTSLPCLAIVKQDAQSLIIDVANPDLALYKGPADEIYKGGKRVERSIYSRPWRPDESKETILEVTIKGRWSSDDISVEISYTEEGDTKVHFRCKDGISQRIVLQVSEQQV
ncbi:hypothetical protein J1N10_14275 [Carboxylicivirga sp. A043]|uniref:chondroitinase family polysaccharide lyase n=1 Tax=Carboxylicivirga litoralis TaxID=2816963 RepID=UPI0021CB64B7|nr:chondroitinase family polysaccharide lyase [Carboxylicivirga sp. A043]MCU4157150.1 hypothetical protein [Carboxylicivirga sp. A043]